MSGGVPTRFAVGTKSGAQVNRLEPATVFLAVRAQPWEHVSL
jgi:hypothetical protein